MWCYDGEDVFANRALQKINTAMGSFSTNQVKKLNQNCNLHKQIKSSGNSHDWVTMLPSASALPADKTIICKTIKLSRACWVPRMCHWTILIRTCCQLFPHIYIYIHSLKISCVRPSMAKCPRKYAKGDGEGLVTCIHRNVYAYWDLDPGAKLENWKKLAICSQNSENEAKTDHVGHKKTSCYSFLLLIIGFHVPALPLCHHHHHSNAFNFVAWNAKVNFNQSSSTSRKNNNVFCKFTLVSFQYLPDSTW